SPHLDLYPFPTRRSSDLDRKWLRRRRLHPPLDADRFLRDADERFPRDAIEDVEEPGLAGVHEDLARPTAIGDVGEQRRRARSSRSEEHTSELQSPYDLVC